jgi:hypothetical protein
MYVVVPYSRAANGRYEVVADVDGGELPQVPVWIKNKLLADGQCSVSGSLDLLDQRSLSVEALSDADDPHHWQQEKNVIYQRCDRWDQTRDQVRYRVFRKKDNAKIYHKVPLATIKDRSHTMSCRSRFRGKPHFLGRNTTSLPEPNTRLAAVR